MEYCANLTFFAGAASESLCVGRGEKMLTGGMYVASRTLFFPSAVAAFSTSRLTIK